MTFLLDTHLFIWLALEPQRISGTTLAVLRDPTNTLLVSTASVWEMQIKAALGKIMLPGTVFDFVQAQRETEDIQSLPVYEHHIWALADLPLHHRDPFDRLLIAQAMVEDCTLVTADAVFDHYPVRLLS